MIRSTYPAHQPTVLLVDNDSPMRDELIRLLVREGYLVLTAASGHDAIASLRTPLSPIDVVLLEVQLPDVNGVALCARCRELFPDLPIVVCTCSEESEDTEALFRLGIRRRFRKPIAVAELLSTVEEAIPVC